MKKLIIVLCLLLLSGCSTLNALDHSLVAYHTEEFKCVEGHKIWIYGVGKDQGGYAITSQIVGACEVEE